jgi:PAS domain S-box-containing protein
MNKTLPEVKFSRKKSKKHLITIIENDSGNAPAKNDDFIKLLSENSRDVIFRAHYFPAFGYDYISQSSTPITGYTPEEFLADPLLPKKCILPEDLHLMKDPAPADAPVDPEPVLLRWRHKDGRIIWMEHFITINRNERGQAETCLIIARDATERRLAEETVQLERNKLQSVINAMADGLTIQDEKHNILFQNKPTKLSSGGDHVGEKCYRIYENRDTVCDGCPVQLAFKDGKTHTSERKRYLPSGEISFWEVTANPIRDVDGKVVSCLEIGRDITERTKQEQALADEVTRRRILVDQSRDGIVVLDTNGRVYDANQRFAETLGYSVEEALQLAVWDWEYQYPHDQVLEMIRTVDETGDHFETRHRRKDGSICDVEISTNGAIFAGQKLIFCVCRDITERKKAEKELQESQRFNASLLENAPHATVVINPDTSIKYVNPAWERLNGWTLAEVIGMKAPYPWWPEEFKEAFLAGFKEAMKQDSGKGEVIAAKKNGEQYWIDMNWASVTHNGELQYLLINSVDITERKIAEEKRQAILKTALDGFWICDLGGKFLEVNDSYCDMTGYTQEELLKMSILDVEAVENPEETSQRIKKIVEQGSDRFETRHRRKDGEVINIEISVNYYNIAEEQLFVFVRDITARKAAEKALQESEEKFSVAFHSSPDMMAIMNTSDGHYTEVNDSFINSLGYSREEIVGHRAHELNLLANPEEANRMNQLIKEQGKFRQEEFRFRTRSGEIRTWLCSIDIISIGGEPSILCVATDITERKKAREAIRESEEKFSKAFHASPGSISISRLSDGKFIEVNESFCRDKGYTRKDIIGRSSLDLTIWANLDDGKRIMKTLKEGGHVRNEVIQYRTKSGFVRTGLTSAELINIGNEPCMIVLNNDITQQKQAEEQLRMLSSVTQQVSDSIIITDPGFRITYMNRAAQDLFGYTIDEAKGKNLEIFNAVTPPEKTRRDMIETVTRAKMWSSTIAKKRKDGSIIVCDCRLSPLYDNKGQINAYIDVQRDVTDQKEVEAEIQAQKQLIESILATMPEGVLVIGADDRIILANESVRQIFHRKYNSIKNRLLRNIIPVEQLNNLYNDVKLGKNTGNTLEFRYRSQNMDKIIACAAIKMDAERTLLTFTDVSREREEEEKLYLTDRLASIGEMAAGLAHELNNPLTGILSLSQLLIDSDIPQEPREDLECIHNEAKRAASIVKNVLLFTRNNNYENGQATVNEVVSDVLRLREYEERTNNITIVTHLQENLPEIPIDKFQLQQVFLNIILNAEAAIKDAGRPGLLTITTERVNNHINVHFSDNGCGIKKHVLPRIFDPFFTTKDIGKGTGLGLSICYGIVVKHGGKISVRTRVNEGTTFTVKMPVAP